MENMEKKEKEKKAKKSRKALDDDISQPRRSTRSKIRQMTAELQSENEHGSQAKKVEKCPDTPKTELPNLLGCSAVDLIVTPDRRSKRMNRSLEENLLAFLDGSATADPDEILEDKMMFLEATHSVCVVPSMAHVPTPKMCQAILQFIQECECVGLTVSSFELLTDLEKRHPRVAVTEVTSSDSGRKGVDLIIDQKVWSPLEETCKEQVLSDRQLGTNSTVEVSSNILTLLEAIARRLRRREKPDGDSTEWGENYNLVLSQFMMLQHLLSLTQTDLHCRLKVFNEDKDFSVVQESYLYRLLCGLNQPDKKVFMMRLNSIMDSINFERDEEGMDGNGCSRNSDLPPDSPQKNTEQTTAALHATSRDFGRLASDLLVLIMKVDTLNQEFGVTTTLSTRRNRLLFDSLLSLCTEATTLDTYLKATSDPRAKLKFVVDYFVNFFPNQVAQTLVDCSLEALEESMKKLLSCFTDQKTLKSVVKVFKETSALPLLLSHAFQAFLLLHSLDDGHSSEQINYSPQESRIRVCNSMIIALNNLKSNARLKTLIPIAEETLFVATRITAS